MCMFVCVQGVKGSSVSPVERVISVSPSCQPAIIEVSYVDGDGHTTSIKPNQDVLGVCGDNIRQISESRVGSFFYYYCYY